MPIKDRNEFTISGSALSALQLVVTYHYLTAQQAIRVTLLDFSSRNVLLPFIANLRQVSIQSSVDAGSPTAPAFITLTLATFNTLYPLTAIKKAQLVFSYPQRHRWNDPSNRNKAASYQDEAEEDDGGESSDDKSGSNNGKGVWKREMIKYKEKVESLGVVKQTHKGQKRQDIKRANEIKRRRQEEEEEELAKQNPELAETVRLINARKKAKMDSDALEMIRGGTTTGTRLRLTGKNKADRSEFAAFLSGLKDAFENEK